MDGACGLSGCYGQPLCRGHLLLGGIGLQPMQQIYFGNKLNILDGALSFIWSCARGVMSRDVIFCRALNEPTYAVNILKRHIFMDGESGL